MERELVTREGVEFRPIRAGGLHGVGAARAARSGWRLAQGVVAARGIVGQFKPDVVLLTGGFVGVPVCVAARAAGAPSVVYLPDVEPGEAVKFMAKFATRIATTTEASADYLPAAKMVVTGYPLRESFARANREAARVALGIAHDARVLMVYGGSKGAQSINRALLDGLDALLDVCEVIHVSGAANWDDARRAAERLTDVKRARYRPFAYLHEEMADALAAADLAVCRAGASALGELPALGLPAILVPYPSAWRYQKVNAAYLAERGAATMLRDEDLGDAERGLMAQALALLGDDARLQAMREAAKKLARPDGAVNIARVVMSLAAQNKKTGAAW